MNSRLKSHLNDCWQRLFTVRVKQGQKLQAFGKGRDCAKAASHSGRTVTLGLLDCLKPLHGSGLGWSPGRSSTLTGRQGVHARPNAGP
jgi:hypothetical protein